MTIARKHVIIRIYELICKAEYILPEITANFVLKIFTTKFVLNDEACARNGNRANFSENDKIPSFLLF